LKNLQANWAKLKKIYEKRKSTKIKDKIPISYKKPSKLQKKVN